MKTTTLLLLLLTFWMGLRIGQSIGSVDAEETVSESTQGGN